MLITYTDAAGVKYVLEVSNSQLFFGSQQVGNVSEPQVLKLKNIGWANISLKEILVAGNSFALEGTNPTVLRPSESISFTVTFTPTSTGPSTGSIFIDAGVAGRDYIQLFGAGFTSSDSNDITGMPVTELASDLETEEFLNYPNGTWVFVINDPIIENIGFYEKVGDPGTGSFEGPKSQYTSMLANAQLDSETIEIVANGPADLVNPGHEGGTVTTREGNIVKTMARAIADATARPYPTYAHMLSTAEVYGGFYAQVPPTDAGTHASLPGDVGAVSDQTPNEGFYKAIPGTGYVRLGSSQAGLANQYSLAASIYADDALAGASESRAWAQSPTPPDPSDLTSKSAKTWAEAAANDVENSLDARLNGFRVGTNTPPGLAIAFTSLLNSFLLGGIKEDASWLIKLAEDAIIPVEALVNVLPDAMGGFKIEPLSDPVWSHVLKSSNGFVLGNTRRADGRLRLALTEDSKIPMGAFSGDIDALISTLLRDKRQAPVSGRLFYSGDSLTAGAGGAGVTYPLTMSNQLGLPYINTAVGGTRTASIGVRQGGVPMVITLANDLPATTSEVDVATYSQEFTNNQGSQTIQGRLVFSDNSPDLLVTLRRYGTVENAAITLKYTISRRAAGSESIEIPPDTIFVSDAAYGNELDFHYIQCGQNDDKSTRAKRVQLRDYILQMVDRVGHDRFCILGQKYVSVAEAAADSQKVLFNQELHDTFGDHFAWSEVAYMGSQKLFDDMGITPTSEDLTYIAAGAVAPSLRIDAVHGNPTYYRAQGEFMARWHRARGWHFNKGA